MKVPELPTAFNTILPELPTTSLYTAFGRLVWTLKSRLQCILLKVQAQKTVTILQGRCQTRCSIVVQQVCLLADVIDVFTLHSVFTLVMQNNNVSICDLVLGYYAEQWAISWT